MHDEAAIFVGQALGTLSGSFGFSPNAVLEVGSRNVNGSIRSLFPLAERYIGIDIQPGPGVDVVCDATDPLPLSAMWFDTFVCTEVFEHCEFWQDIVGNVAEFQQRHRRVAILTMACEPRAPHSAQDGGDLQDGEYYQNVDADELYEVLADHYSTIQISGHPRGDLYALAYNWGF